MTANSNRRVLIKKVLSNVHKSMKDINSIHNSNGEKYYSEPRRTVTQYVPLKFSWEQVQSECMMLMTRPWVEAWSDRGPVQTNNVTTWNNSGKCVATGKNRKHSTYQTAKLTTALPSYTRKLQIQVMMMMMTMTTIMVHWHGNRKGKCIETHTESVMHWRPTVKWIVEWKHKKITQQNGNVIPHQMLLKCWSWRHTGSVYQLKT